jgi:hypothetical protein
MCSWWRHLHTAAARREDAGKSHQYSTVQYSTVTSKTQRVDANIYAADRQLVEVYVQLVAVSAHSSSRQYHAGSYIIGSSTREQDAKGHVACENYFT